MKQPNEMKREEALQAWYVAEGKRGQQLLDAGQLDRATEVFEAVLTRVGDTPSFGRAVILERLGRCSHFRGRADLAVAQFREAMGVTEGLAASDGVKGLRGVLHSDLGEALRATGQHGEARKAYEAALRIAEELKDLRAQGVDLGQLGALALAEGRLAEARDCYQRALKLLQPLGESAMEAVVWQQLGRTLANIADKEAAATEDSQTREALQSRARDLRQIEWYAPRFLATLARLGENASHGRAVILERLGRCLQLVGRPDLAIVRFREAMAVTEKLGPGDGVKGLRGTLHSALGDAFRASGHFQESREAYKRALEIAEELQDLFGAGSALRQLGALAQETRQPDEAERYYNEAARLVVQAEGRGAPIDPGADLSFINGAGPHPRDGALTDAARSFDVTVHDDLTIDYVFDTDLLVDGRRERRIRRWTTEPYLLADDVRPALPPCTRTCVDDPVDSQQSTVLRDWRLTTDDSLMVVPSRGWGPAPLIKEATGVRFCLPPGEPVIELDSGCTIMRRTLREVVVSGSSDILWRLIRSMDGAHTVAEMISQLPIGERAIAARMLAALAATGAIDVSGRPIGRFLHSATKKGVVPGGGLESAEVLQLATDGNYRTYPGAPRIAVGESVPDRLRSFHALTRSRRSHRDYAGQAVGRADFDALLQTACGVTGAMPWAGRDVKLRAYPASGALYAVEIYPVVLRVEGLEPCVYHYRATEGVLEVVRADIDPAHIVGAALPVEREMVAGAAAMICLAGFFPRHERKYGQGGYRMLVAEAGHISHSLILAATALGLSARPFGGVFDDLLNHELGLDGEDEQFLLAVLVGHAA